MFTDVPGVYLHPSSRPYHRRTITQPPSLLASLLASMAASSLKDYLPHLYAEGFTNTERGETLSSNYKTNTAKF